MTRIALLLTALVLFSCDKTLLENSPFEVGETVKLHFDIPRSESNDQFEIVFNELIQDSRCGTDVECVWEGIGIIQLSLTNNEETFEFNLSTFDWEDYSQSTVVAGLRFTLVSLKPHPKGEKPVEPKNYYAEVLIESASE
jgi:hypothetical protein